MLLLCYGQRRFSVTCSNSLPRPISSDRPENEKAVTTYAQLEISCNSLTYKLFFIDGPYGNFAGRDASRGLAMNSFDKSMLASLDGPIDKLEDLKEDEKSALEDWEILFDGKYQLVGKLIENKD